jgi:uncharacterized protein (TIGR02265 family)
MAMQIRGSILHTRIHYVKTHFGTGAWQRILDTLSKEDQDILKGIVLHVGWYAFALGERLDQAIVNILGHGDPKIFEEIGAQSARDNLSGVHRSFLTQGEPQKFMAQANNIYKFYYNSGFREYEKTGPSSCVIRTREVEAYSFSDCLTVIGWYREALKMCGAKNVEIIEEACRAKGDSFCQYRFEWEM